MTNIFQECINYPKYWDRVFNRLRSGPFEGPAIVKPPALPEDTYLQTFWALEAEWKEVNEHAAFAEFLVP